jgi:4-diphosphocytidyl-2-C-methyl-D-erythritol kinase
VIARARPRRVEITAHAKLNLGLAVGPARADGFHELVTVFQSISLADTLIATRAPRGLSLALRHEDVALRGKSPASARAAVPRGTDNLVLRAARRALDHFGLAGGVRFTLIKRIPAGAGMGGGSADAAAAIMAIAALHGLRLTREDRIAMAADIGSDVPFSITGGTALGRGRGELLSPLRLRRAVRAVVAVPSWRVSTARAFDRIDRSKYGLTRWTAHLRLAASLGRRQVTPIDSMRLGNTFEGALGPRKRDFDGLCARLGAAGLLQPHLTGSGSGVFGILPRGVPARRVSGRFSGNEQLFAARFVGRGLRIQTQP